MRPAVLSTAEIADNVATESLHVLHRPPSEAEQALAVVAPQAIRPDGHAHGWEPQPNETAQEYAAFLLWLKSGTACPSWPVARRLKWQQRADAYLAQAQVPYDEAAFQGLVLEATTVAVAWASHELSKHLASAATTPQPAASVGDTVRVLKEAATLRRLLVGLSTENISVRGMVTADQIEKSLSDDDLEQLARMRMKVRSDAEKNQA